MPYLNLIITSLIKGYASFLLCLKFYTKSATETLKKM